MNYCSPPFSEIGSPCVALIGRPGTQCVDRPFSPGTYKRCTCLWLSSAGSKGVCYHSQKAPHSGGHISRWLFLKEHLSMAPTDQGIARSYQSTHSRKGMEVKKFSSFGSSCPTLLDGWIKTAYIYCAAVLENINEVKIQGLKYKALGHSHWTYQCSPVYTFSLLLTDLWSWGWEIFFKRFGHHISSSKLFMVFDQ